MLLLLLLEFRLNIIIVHCLTMLKNVYSPIFSDPLFFLTLFLLES